MRETASSIFNGRYFGVRFESEGMSNNNRIVASGQHTIRIWQVGDRLWVQTNQRIWLISIINVYIGDKRIYTFIQLPIAMSLNGAVKPKNIYIYINQITLVVRGRRKNIDIVSRAE